MNKFYILALITLLGQSAFAQIREFQTTRLNSTAGAGLASVLSTESLLLNPASAAFFTGSSLSYQHYSTSLRHSSQERDSNQDSFPNHNTSQGFFMTDNDGPIKGGLGMIQQKENHYTRRQIASGLAANITDTTSLGFNYHYILDRWPDAQLPRHRTEHQVNAGLITILDDSTTLGLVLYDATRTLPGEERLAAGVQYSIASRFVVLADFGTQYTKSIMEKHFWKAAAQFQLFDDLFIRVGKFHDNVRLNKGTGWGVSWIGPKLGVEFAQKITDQYGTGNYIYRDESLVDTSLSAIIKF